MLILTLYVKILRRFTSTRICHHLAGTFFTIQEGSKRRLEVLLVIQWDRFDEGEGNKLM